MKSKSASYHWLPPSLPFLGIDLVVSYLYHFSLLRCLFLTSSDPLHLCFWFSYSTIPSTSLSSLYCQRIERLNAFVTCNPYFFVFPHFSKLSSLKITNEGLLGRGNEEWLLIGKEFLLGFVKMFWNLVVVMVAQLRIY